MTAIFYFTPILNASIVNASIVSNVQNSMSAPCFSYNTLKKILNHTDSTKKLAVVHWPRNNKKMYRCKIKNFGEAEFTHDHPFLYANKIFEFHELINNTQISDITEIPNDEINVVYNIIGSTNQLSIENIFYINDKLMMIGGKFNFQITQQDFEKKYNIIQNLLKDDSYKDDAENKYFIKI